MEEYSGSITNKTAAYDGIPEAYNGPGNYIVVSYCHADSAVVVSEIRELQKRGIHIWYDQGLVAGETWDSQVLDRISNDACSGVIFYISDTYYSKDTFWKEAEMASDRRKKFCVVMLGITGSTGAIKMTVNDLYLEFKKKLTKVYMESLESGKMPDETFSVLIKVFDKDRIYINISDSTRMDSLLKCFEDWGYYVPKAVFPLCNVLHNGHIEYFPSLLTATPFNFTFIAIAGQQRYIAAGLNEDRPQGILWHQYSWNEWLHGEQVMSEFQKEHEPEVEKPGVVVWIDEGDMSEFCEILEKRRAIAPKAPLIINIVTEDLSKADGIVASVKRYLSGWQYLNRDIKNNDVEMNDLFVTETEKQSGCVYTEYNDTFQRRGDEPWRIVVSARKFKEQLNAGIKVSPQIVSWLFRQLPLDGINRFVEEFDIVDSRLENCHDRIRFRTDEYNWETNQNREQG